jgi:hypothetical protein
MATSRIIFNVPASVKKRALARAKREGITLTQLLTTAAGAYAAGNLELSHPELYATPAAIRRFNTIAREAKEGKNMSPAFSNADDARRWLESAR